MLLGFLGLIVASVFLCGLLSAGFYKMALKQVRGRAISVSDLFDVKDIFWPMLGMSLVVGLAVGIGMQLMYIPGYILGGLWMLAGPLLVERRMGVFDAMGASWKALQPELVMAAFYYFVISLVASLGALVLLVGILFTLPLFYLGQALVYRDFFPDPVSDPSFDV
jgi:uncharacterized membrane protein